MTNQEAANVLMGLPANEQLSRTVEAAFDDVRRAALDGRLTTFTTSRWDRGVPVRSIKFEWFTRTDQGAGL